MSENHARDANMKADALKTALLTALSLSIDKPLTMDDYKSIANTLSMDFERINRGII